jgi:branched-chain amino acid transport system ATP-binding protein
MTPILEIKAVSVQFGGVRAVQEISLAIEPGEFIGLIGPNGAGKTTIFNLITNSVQPTTGTILFKNVNISKLSPDKINHLGISRTFQNIRLFPNMSAFDNVALGMYSRTQYSLFEAFLKLPKARSADAAVKEKTMDLLELVNLTAYAKETAGNLPYGLQRRLELARAMAASPDLLLLDEPAAGMNEDECRDLVRLIRLIHDTKGYAIILIEHHMQVVMDLCVGSRIFVLNLGKILAVGSPSEIQSNSSVIQAYLGDKRVQNGNQSTAPAN